MNKKVILVLALVFVAIVSALLFGGEEKETKITSNFVEKPTREKETVKPVDTKAKLKASLTKTEETLPETSVTKQENIQTDHDSSLFKYETYSDVKNYIVTSTTIFDDEVSEHMASFLLALKQDNLIEAALSNVMGYGQLYLDSNKYSSKPKFINSLLVNAVRGMKVPEFYKLLEGKGTVTVYADWPEEFIDKVRKLKLPDLFVVSKKQLTVKLNALEKHRSVTEVSNISETFKLIEHMYDGLTADLKGEFTVSIGHFGNFLGGSLFELANTHDNPRDVAKDLRTIGIRGIFLVDSEQFFVQTKRYAKYFHPIRSKQHILPVILQNGQFKLPFQIDQQKGVKGTFTEIDKYKSLLPKELQNFGVNSKIRFPVYVHGAGLLNYFKTVRELEKNFTEQSFFPIGTSLQVELEVDMAKLDVRNQREFWQALDLLDINRFIYRSLDAIKSDLAYEIDFTLDYPELNLLRTFVELTKRYRNENSEDRHLETIKLVFPEDNLKNGMFRDYLEKLDWYAANQKAEYGKVTLNIKDINELVPIFKLQENLQLGQMSLDVRLLFTTKLMQSSLPTRGLIKFLNEEFNVLSLSDIVRQSLGEGIIRLYPHPDQYRDPEVLAQIKTILKNNKEALNNWHTLKGNFIYMVPQSFEGEAQPGTLRHIYEFINNGPKNQRKQRINMLVREINKYKKTNYDIPNDLSEILEVVSDKRHLSDVLKERQEDEEDMP